MSFVETDVARQGRNRAIGIFCALGGAFLFSANDVLIKLLSSGYALHQVVLIRSLIALGVLLALIVPLQGGIAALRTRRIGMHVLRGLCVVIANMTFFTALAAMPLVDAVAIFFVSPLLITAFSVLILGESVGARRWGSVIIGLLGVVIMLRPGTDAFRLAALLPLIAATGYAMLQILTRKIGGTESATAMTFYILLTFIAVSGAMGLFFGDGRFAGSGHASIEFLFRAWIWPEPRDWLTFVALGFASAFAGVLISQAYRVGEAAVIAPFEYVAMPLAVFWGVVAFGEWPDTIAWAGTTLIVGGGIYMFVREALANRRIAARRPPPVR
ncbi:Riboflavin transporter [Defluviimonas aquaemixtae]|uniref:Riboflavin transporter n=1 Tax=Albidovulum aquaemixtae TaxID=1542388 RepID=A0A2R8B2C2_9RHOB|nr:DMT family transporter [Defluviimonas aquaemixtae]SPH16695.1 Riboflavin transporter [Defluviimonas aquaemixtae]